MFAESKFDLLCLRVINYKVHLCCPAIKSLVLSILSKNYFGIIIQRKEVKSYLNFRTKIRMIETYMSFLIINIEIMCHKFDDIHWFKSSELQ